jgi:hypothetical protein
MRLDEKVEDESTFPATVVNVPDNFTVVINRGRKHGIENGQSFLIYTLSDEEILDPTNNKLLGHLEIVRGTGEVINVQESMSTIKSDMEDVLEKEIVRDRWGMGPERVLLKNRKIPFDFAEKGDKAKPV